MASSAPRDAAPATSPAGRSPVVVALMCAIGVGCVMFDQTSLVVAAPTIGADLGAGLSGLQWLTAMFPLVAASAMPVSGMLGERWGARTTLQVGLAVFALGGVAAALSANLGMLLGARIVQGIGAALVLPNGATLLGANLAHGPVRARAVGYWMMTSSTGLLLGPILSGALAEHYGWRSTFLVVVPVALLAIAVTSRLGTTPRRSPGPLDLAGLVTACTTLALLSWSLIATGRGSAPVPLVVAGYVAALLLARVFLAIERRATRPLLDLELFASRRLRTVLLACLAYNAAINGTAFLISVHFQDGRGFSSTSTGWLLVIANAGMPLAGMLVNALRPFLAPATLMVLSLLTLAAAYLWLGLGSELPVAALLVPLVLVGVGAGVLYSVDTGTVLDSADGHQSAPAMASLALMRQIGSVLGIATLASAGQVAVAVDLTPRGEAPAFVLAAVALAVLGLVVRRQLARS
ncbi:MFS transporter [Nocardioides pantholopis]|uniref:MFS transporter n=1 Tax=Nocardioides pantholopis TaxID=2483798 RepID=UPI000F090C7B|nr:MFS transporter [Nocardioides pantholopis]